MMSMTRTITVAALAIGLAACEAQNADDPNVMTGGADTMAQSGMDSITQQQEGMGERMEFEFEPVNNSGASGEVYITPAAGRTTVILTVTTEGDTSAQGQRHAAHIHTGTCENIGSVVAPLEAVTTVSGEGTSTTLLGQDLETFADGNHVAAVHEAGGEPGTPILCTPIPAGGGTSGSDTAGSDTTQTSI